ncbi:hypothetical protein DEO72_LG4g640 [Vigna unguiculata]|uniref:Uncharacterized protein n=1 Tax=Vigna unguiculata TaxID=3917 RepID=A0A4D6LNU5_VIGUN|nr:hypothetical protein DEO72_LG4g640 [Vigna unguiculata]
MTGRMSVILAQASEARLGENNRNAKPSLCSSISLGREQLALARNRVIVTLCSRVSLRQGVHGLGD